jgi:hypothetical protein
MWSKTMEALSFLNPGDPMPYESLSAMDRTHRLVVSGIWEIPVGRGRQYGASMPAVAEFLAGRVAVECSVQRQSGHPNLFTPNKTPTSSTFDMISQDVPRIWQLALRVIF